MATFVIPRKSAVPAVSFALLLAALPSHASPASAHRIVRHDVAASRAAAAGPASAPRDADIPSELWHDPRWVQGPAAVQLGQVASFAVPAGFRALPPSQHAGNGASDPAADSVSDEDEPITALVAPNDGSWSMGLQIDRVGYIDTSSVHLDPADLASTMDFRGAPSVFDASARSQISNMKVVTWVREPRWDAGQRRLDWIDKETVVGTGAISDTTYLNAVKLGRRDAVSMQLELDGDDSKNRAIALTKTFDELVGRLSFRPGQAYADYRDGDATATLALTDYITGPKTDQEKADEARIANSLGFDWTGFFERILPLAGVAFAGLGARRWRQTRRNGGSAG
ncbi:DUF2167 domain-containing protein [Trinickia soli]|uniref:DUF2167 domain-containing protein n=1 Tax=Trinickia soli TaxID=380675 RepID=A0A2N7WFT6_9BURK|nr:DUF2167 domain-containing protein [Trinickia soli]KAA0089755.1 DUF2167 domain-containing protein [Paraburkholderia sp. T12-10]PMS28221.1 hypothetical protein C0Z19_00325 [Trinickia soli]CAB3663245.1 hypothetical protein LMG24076_01559 [Trinickia soli]